MPIGSGSRVVSITVVFLLSVASRSVCSPQPASQLDSKPQASSVPSPDQVAVDTYAPPLATLSRAEKDDRLQVNDATATSTTAEEGRYAESRVSADPLPSGKPGAYYGGISDHVKEEIVTEVIDLDSSSVAPRSVDSVVRAPPPNSTDTSKSEPPTVPISDPLPAVLPVLAENATTPAIDQDTPTFTDVSQSGPVLPEKGAPVEVDPTVTFVDAAVASDTGSSSSPTSQPAEAAPPGEALPHHATVVTAVIPPYPSASPWLTTPSLRPNAAVVTLPATAGIYASPASPGSAGSFSSFPTLGELPSPSSDESPAATEPLQPIPSQPSSAPLPFTRLPATSARSASPSDLSSPTPRGVFDPRFFGAAGNGVADDTAALNAAFAAACAYRAPTSAQAPRGQAGRVAASAALSLVAEEQGDRRVAQQQISGSSGRNDSTVTDQTTPRQLMADAATVQGARVANLTAVDAATDVAPETATLLLPAGRTFLVASWITWHGPCRGKGLLIQIDGLLQFEPNAAKRIGRGAMIVVTRVDGLTIAGSGRIDGGGDLLWRRPANSRPHLLLLAEMRRIVVTGITLSNAPMMHLVLRSCVGASVQGITTRSPASSPNTDSIHVSACSYVSISDSLLHGGDDDVSIVAGSSAISINNVTCTAGHGISIGSLGYGGKTACVSNVTVTNSVLSGLDNGLRIKTYRGGSGSVFNIRYENITMTNVARPIIIDQSYCDDQPCGSGPLALSIFNITYRNISAVADSTSSARATARGIQLSCSRTVPCTGISLSQVRIAQGAVGGAAAAVASRTQGSIKSAAQALMQAPSAMYLVNAFGASDGRAFPVADRARTVSLESAAGDDAAAAAAGDALVSAEQRLALAAQRLKCGV